MARFHQFPERHHLPRHPDLRDRLHPALHRQLFFRAGDHDRGRRRRSGHCAGAVQQVRRGAGLPAWLAGTMSSS